MSWVRLDPNTYAGPLVAARVHRLEPPHPADAPAFVEGWALVDTGATHSAIDVTQVATPLGLPVHDHRRMVLAEHGAVDVPVHEVAVTFPDFSLPRRVVRVNAMRLPAQFLLLVGMDLLEGTRFELDVDGDARWVRWRAKP